MTPTQQTNGIATINNNNMQKSKMQQQLQHMSLNMLPPTADLLHHYNILDHYNFDASPYLTLLSRGGGTGMKDATPPSESVTLTVLLGGFAAIVWFFVSEYNFLKEKTATMVDALSANSSSSSSSDADSKKDFTIMDLIDYRLEYFFSSSEWANVILLLGLSYLLVVFGAGLLVVADSDDYSTISEAAWTSWTYVVDPGAQADAPSDFVPRTVSLVVTLGGLLVFALLIGIVGESIGEKLEDFKTGKSRVFESGHTLMLNWNDKVRDICVVYIVYI